ncbi:uncharacterized protein LOC129218284 [Uloborus diversus]|uniref:uncharacterized protein LOC129218284 n=1 Tax=Uloborus diversus TaxID=327109 RepID=UPI0024093E3B|nr:uncharacterized protein LOC129218284 [Uloborus diversus]
MNFGLGFNLFSIAGDVIKYCHMGIISSRFKWFLSFRKSPDVYKRELEEINKAILQLEKNKIALIHQYHLIIEFIVSYSRLLYLLVVIVFFFSALPSTPVECFLFCGPLVVFYILIYVLKRILKMYFDDEVRRLNLELTKLYARKKILISEVKDKVKYYDARDIIENCVAIKESGKNLDNNVEVYPTERRHSMLNDVVKYVFKEEKKNSLICKYCWCHNGMALEEEFKSLSFRCCQCFKLNKSEKCSFDTVNEN